MAYSEFLADRVRQRLSNADLVVEKKMMGGLYLWSMRNVYRS